MVLDGWTAADIPGLLESRQARTLTALVRARLATVGSNVDEMERQVWILALPASVGSVQEAGLLRDVEALFDAAALERGMPEAEFSKYYDVRVEFVAEGEGEKVRWVG